jgi:hypothetical protein
MLTFETLIIATKIIPVAYTMFIPTIKTAYQISSWCWWAFQKTKTQSNQSQHMVLVVHEQDHEDDFVLLNTHVTYM